MKLGLILTNDWELFGNGSGNYFDIQYKPLKDLLGIIDDFKAKITVFAEVAQQWAHQELAVKEDRAKKITSAWEFMLQKTIKMGSDVQMHLHPQWLNAKYRDNTWHLDYNHWALASLDYKTMKEKLIQGKQYLEKILKPIDKNYECIAFRACGFYIQPSKATIHNLVEAGFKCDTSVIKGLYDPPYIDFRKAYSNCLPWIASREDVNLRSNNKDGIVEIPIYSRELIDIPILRKVVTLKRGSFKEALYCFHFGANAVSEADLGWLKERERIKNERYPESLRKGKIQSKKESETSFLQLLRKIFTKIVRKNLFVLDYNDLPPKVFVKCIKEIRKQKIYLTNPNNIIPIVALGHTKGMHNCENIKKILYEIKKTFSDEELIFWTIRDAVSFWEQALLYG
jgi:hypothetical protein